MTDDEKRGLVQSTTWPYVLAFALRMEAKLAKNRHKGDRDGWIKDSPERLRKRLDDEVEELATEIALYGGRPLGSSEHSAEVADEAADVANFAMMIADVAGGVTPEPSLVVVERAQLERLRPLIRKMSALTAFDEFGMGEDALAILDAMLRGAP